MKVMEGVKVAECESKLKKSFQDTSYSCSMEMRKFCNAIDSRIVAKTSGFRDEKITNAEDSLRMVMYLSCWGPN
ncbi:hypothetical protein ACHQM5_003493 [Ranunculus cassubicifolius]